MSPAAAHCSATVKYRCTASIPLTYGLGSPGFRIATRGSFLPDSSNSEWFEMMLSAPALSVGKIRGLEEAGPGNTASQWASYVELSEVERRNQEKNRRGAEDSRSNSRHAEDSRRESHGSEAHESSAGFSTAFRANPFGRGVRRRPLPEAVRARVGPDTPEFCVSRRADELLREFACGLGSGGISTHPRPKRVSSIPTTYNSAHVERRETPSSGARLEFQRPGILCRRRLFRYRRENGSSPRIPQQARRARSKLSILRQAQECRHTSPDALWERV